MVALTEENKRLLEQQGVGLGNILTDTPAVTRQLNTELDQFISTQPNMTETEKRQYRDNIPAVAEDLNELGTALKNKNYEDALRLLGVNVNQVKAALNANQENRYGSVLNLAGTGSGGRSGGAGGTPGEAPDWDGALDNLGTQLDPLLGLESGRTKEVLGTGANIVGDLAKNTYGTLKNVWDDSSGLGKLGLAGIGYMLLGKPVGKFLGGDIFGGVKDSVMPTIGLLIAGLAINSFSNGGGTSLNYHVDNNRYDRVDGLSSNDRMIPADRAKAPDAYVRNRELSSELAVSERGQLS